MKAMKVFLLLLFFTCVVYVTAPIYDNISPPQDVTIIIDVQDRMEFVSTIDVDVISEDPFQDSQQFVEFLSGEQIILVASLPQSIIETNENLLNIRDAMYSQRPGTEGIIFYEHKGKPFQRS